MASWDDINRQAPDLGRAVQDRFDATLHKALATLRSDGSPRISGTEVKFVAGGVWLGSMGGSMKARDLQRDGRCALHSTMIDEKMVEGDAKLAGVAVEVTDLDAIREVWPEWEEQHAAGGAHAFRVDVFEVALTRVVGDELVITSWTERDGHRERRRT